MANNQISYSEKIGDVEVAQKLGFVRGSSHMLDTVGISYTLTDHGTSNHAIGVRVLLDTMCGDNDGAPMRVGKDALTNPRCFPGRRSRTTGRRSTI